jgi:alkanesulfonate monooxygenase
MEIRLRNRVVRSFTISPRTLDERLYWENIRTVAQLSQRYSCTGILIFTGNDTFVEPWLVAHSVILESEHLSPLVAVNPMYLHPFTAAKMVSSFAYLYKRKIYLNMVTGTALSHSQALNDQLSHDERYERLAEYIQIIQGLTSGTRAVNFDGRFYKVASLTLQPKVPENLTPEFLIAGQSEAAQRVVETTGSIGMQMLQPKLELELGKARGIHLGIITRRDRSAAWDAAQALFPEDRRGQKALDISMSNTDSVWKRRMRLAAEEPDVSASGYWLAPFRNFRADCPYFVGSHQEVADLLVRLIRKGIEVFILDIPAQEIEFQNINTAFEIAERALGAKEIQEKTL